MGEAGLAVAGPAAAGRCARLRSWIGPPRWPARLLSLGGSGRRQRGYPHCVAPVRRGGRELRLDLARPAFGSQGFSYRLSERHLV